MGRLQFVMIIIIKVGVIVSHCGSPNGNSQAGSGDVIGVAGCNRSELVPRTPWNFNWDGRDPTYVKRSVWCYSPSEVDSEKDKEVSSTVDKPLELSNAIRNIILVRHGQYNKKGEDDIFDNDYTLTELGREQSALVGRRLKSYPVKFTSFVSSGSIRAKETAHIILKEIAQEGLSIDINDEILNGGSPCIEQPPHSNNTNNVELWNPDFNKFYEEGKRMEEAFRKYIHRAEVNQKEDSYEIIVCHGSTIRYFAIRAMQLPVEGWLRVKISHSSLTKLTVYGDGKVIMRAIGDAGHLSPNQDTF